MPQRHSTSFFNLTALLLVTGVGLLLHGRATVVAAQPALERRAQLVQTLTLTDLCLFTEASYTRHLTQADLHTPFQEAPLGLEHFPTGALVAPPANLTAGAGGITTGLTVRKRGHS